MQLLKKIKYILLALLFFTNACNNNNSSYPEATNALDAGREFIDATLKGDFAKAYFYLLQDAENKQLLDKTETDYRTKDRDGREQFRQASINIGEIKDINKNETIITYSNSFDKVNHQLKVVLQNNKWRVDFKYTFK
ncbi:MAG: hypothetical protein H7068_00485 [Pedobacter sp.]|nr:hypothetical protein [Chitinophagaceae bacterium]